MEKLYLLQELYSSKWRNHQIEINSKHSLRPRLQISSHYLTTTENFLCIQGLIYMDSIVIYKLLDTQLHWLLQFRALVILVFNISQKMIQKLSSQLLQLSTFDRRLFSNSVEAFYTRLMPALFMDITSSHQLLE